MPLTKVLNRIHEQIKDLAPTLELFIDNTLQPTTDDCNKLQKQLCQLQEELAVYKFSLSDIDFSPSFKLHAKISEKEVPVSPPDEPAINSPQPEAPPKPETPGNRTDQAATSGVKPLVIGVNDKFRFINELFSQNNAEYNIAFQQLNNLSNWNDSEVYLNSLKNLYGWPEKNEAVKYLYAHVKKRFE
jgi:hypothetical protein